MSRVSDASTRIASDSIASDSRSGLLSENKKAQELAQQPSLTHGAIQLLWHTRGSALIISVGALIILLSLATDIFAQQILAFPPRLVPAASNASVPITNHYGVLRNNTPVDIDFGMQRAVNGGLFAAE
ncbi:hypothetical protein LTR08_003995 [Meristemomyces frigidus]|nr:hypothetical protein LTR08_003995 [Meristemomyces frigidus]